jgi:beta-1,4-mannosyltransferase
VTAGRTPTTNSPSAFRVIEWPRHSPSNTYPGALSTALAAQPGVEVVDLAMGPGMLRRVIRERFDILHIHWMERAFWAPSAAAVVRQAAHVTAVMLLAKARGVKIVWTVHDPQPHVSPLNRYVLTAWTRRLWKPYRNLVVRLLDGLLLLSSTHRDDVSKTLPRLGGLPAATVPHPHYRGLYPDTLDRGNARAALGIAPDVGVIAFVGSLRAYKNPEALIEQFKQVNADAVLLVAGAPESPEHAKALEALAASDSRIRLTCGFVPDADLQRWLRAADLSVLPYRRVTNSGSAHLALSFDLPVLVPDEPVFRELEVLVGDRWVKRYSGGLTATQIEEGLRWAREPRPTSPDLSALDWETIAAETLRFFRNLSAGGTGRT